MDTQTTTLVQRISDLGITLHLTLTWSWLSLTQLCSGACAFLAFFAVPHEGKVLIYVKSTSIVQVELSTYT